MNQESLADHDSDFSEKLAARVFLRRRRECPTIDGRNQGFRVRLGITVSLIGSVTHLLRRIKAGESGAWAKLLRRFWPFMLARAGRRLGNRPRRAMDEEDVAQEALIELQRGFADGRWDELANRHDLVALLTHITECRAVNQINHELARTRGGGRVQGESALQQDLGSADSGHGLANAVAESGLTPQEQVLQEEWSRHCLERLPRRLHSFAELHLNGHTVSEIAQALHCTERTVARKIALIRAYWIKQLAESA